MIKKSLTVVALAFMIIFAGSQSNVAEAKEIYMGYFEFRRGPSPTRENLPLRGDLYLLSDTVQGNSNMIVCLTNFYQEGNLSGRIRFTFKKGLKRWAVNRKMGSYKNDVFTYDLTDMDEKILNYILNNYE
ncbi:MAG: hypothetical protein IJL14_06685 [Selenomonadaceae bacterium]|nr:hypothetical protein [Selenomonadaceae bacterium]MBQ6005915.1 hypothetical protein [Selenomonadaceae bacterium]